ncbi:MAG TPA: hypothetical protein VFS85_02795 [Dongiaceae bacterium]|nr:hypothetical protein [Dongiaceae bacterium]
MPDLGLGRLGEALLNLAALRTGLSRAPTVKELPDHLRRDVGLPPRAARIDPRDFRR